MFSGGRLGEAEAAQYDDTPIVAGEKSAIL